MSPPPAYGGPVTTGLSAAAFRHAEGGGGVRELRFGVADASTGGGEEEDELSMLSTSSGSSPSSQSTARLTGAENVDLLYDPILKCYFDPKTQKYYEIK